MQEYNHEEFVMWYMVSEDDKKYACVDVLMAASEQDADWEPAIVSPEFAFSPNAKDGNY